MRIGKRDHGEKVEERMKESVCERASERERGEGRLHAANHWAIGLIRLDVDTIARDRGVKCPPVIGRVVSWSLCTAPATLD